MPTAVEQIILTPVPDGVAASAVNVSVHVAPTLSGGATGFLKDFPDFVNWPQTLINQAGSGLELGFTLTNQGRSETFTEAAQIDTGALQPALWTALFGDGSAVQYAARDSGEPYTTVPVVSYPSDQIASFLESTYANLVIGSPTAYPSLQTLQGSYDPIGYAGASDARNGLLNLWRELSSERLNGISATGAPITPKYANDWSSASATEAMAALRFYHMPANSLQTPAAPTLPVVDFHRALTFISQHRALQRALGLVLDVSIAQRQVGDVGSPGFISVALQTVNGAGLTPSNGVTYQPITPRVQFDFTAGGTGTGNFQAHAATSQIVGGQLTLGDASSFAVYEIDVDGGGLKTAQFADNLKLAQDPQSSDPDSGSGAAPDAPTAYAPPSLKSSGFTVAAVNRGLQFVARLQRGSSLLNGAAASPPAVPDLTAEDLVRGYVLDVYDAPGATWNSTALRDVTYATGGGSPVTITDTDEPGLDSPPRSQTDPTNASQQQLNLPANVIRWTGWSNAAPRPGMPLAADGSSGVETGGPGDGPFNQLAITVTPHPGSLPRLRFGTQYALRARIVDIAGNVLPAVQAAALGDSQNRVTPLTVYGRHEPIGSPDMYNWNQPLPSESLKHLVIRDIDPGATSVRALAPTRIAELFAELHGEFDAAAGGLDPNAYATIIARESARYPFAGATTSGSPLWQPITPTSPVPYLPDPLARGATLYLTDGPNAGSSHQFDFGPPAGQSWPNYQPFELVLAPGGSQGVAGNAGARQLTFTLAPGDTVPAQLSSYVGVNDLPVLGIYEWVRAAYKNVVPDSFIQAATAGLTWAFTPYTQIELIYAVQKPLLVPSFDPFIQFRQLSWTYAEISGDVTYSPKSTARIELLASWSEPVDNGAGTGVPQGPGSPDTTQAPRKSTVYTINSSLRQQDSEQDRFEGRHEFFDTKHRVVAYVGEATSRFTEHYQAQATLTVPAAGSPSPALTLPGKGNLGLQPGSVAVSAGATIYQENTAFTVDPTGATITFEPAPTGPAPGSVVDVDFLPAVTVDSAPLTLDIPSSARPLAPGVEFVVPIYRWSKIAGSGTKKHSLRSPSALRVFLSRPWWSSGIGELLGVTTYGTPSLKGGSAIPDAARPYVSDWGLDPVFAGRDLPALHPSPSSFPARVHTGSGLTLDETAAVKVNVAGHSVSYDESRDLWYADVEVDFGKAYTPMVRLALARYQPDSVAGAELSRVVLADVMSLEPGRAVSIVRKSRTLLSTVTLVGYSYGRDGDDTGNGPGLATLVVERRVSAIHDDTLGWEPVDDPIEMVSSTNDAGLTTWSARQVKIPHNGTHRLWIGQYEAIPQDARKKATYLTLLRKSEGLRLLYQDIIPL
jgi:hypothetical protein